MADQAQEQLVRMLAAELERQDPGLVDLSDGALTQVRVFEVLNLLEMADAVLTFLRETSSG